jgi:hypothetical protein
MIALVALFWMLVGHALADFPLQGPFLSEAKNPRTAIGAQFWPWALGAHGLIHGGAVALATGSVVLGLAETVLHAIIDAAKCSGHLSLHEDQLAHVACKLCWALVLLLQS